MKRYRKLTAACLLIFCLTGCGKETAPEKIAETSIVIHTNDTITYHLIESFEQSYYNLDELTKMASDEVEQYNSEKGLSGDNAVKLEGVTLVAESPGKVSVVYQFPNVNRFCDFEEEIAFFYGTVKEAMDEGFMLDVPLKNIKDDSILDEGQLNQYENKKIVIMQTDAVVYGPAKVMLTSDDVSILEDGGLWLNSPEEKGYIVFHK